MEKNNNSVLYTTTSLPQAERPADCNLTTVREFLLSIKSLGSISNHTRHLIDVPFEQRLKINRAGATTTTTARDYYMKQKLRHHFPKEY